MTWLFGADGIRGVIDQYPLRQEDLERLGRCLAGWYLRENRKPVVIVGTDTRESSQRIKINLIGGLTRGGIEVVDVGVIPTAGISYLVASKGILDGGIIITASHNPITENGMKVFDRHGVKLDDSEEEWISEQFTSSGKLPFRVRPSDVRQEVDFTRQYADALVDEFRHQEWDVPKIVLDCANGAAYQVVQHIFKILDVNAVLVNIVPTGTNINRFGGSEYVRLSPEQYSSELIQYDAELGIALDGDADRAIFIDDHGKFYDGDSILSAMAIHLQLNQALTEDTIITTPMSNSGLEEHMLSRGIKVSEVKNGDKYITSELLNHSLVLGGEPIGHIIHHTDAFHVTGDGLRTLLSVLSLFSKGPESRLERLTGGLRKWPQINVSTHLGYRTAIQAAEMPEVDELIHQIDDAIPDLAQFQCRPASTEPVYRIMMEARQTPTQVLAAYAFVLARKIQELHLALNKPVEIFDCVRGGLIMVNPRAYVGKSIFQKLPR